MNVSVAIGALLADVAKDQTGVAGGADDLLMHSTERVARVVMAKLGKGADRLPIGGGMAVLAGDCQGAVRIGHLGLRRCYNALLILGRRFSRLHAKQQRQDAKTDCNEPSSPGHDLLHRSTLRSLMQECRYTYSFFRECKRSRVFRFCSCASRRGFVP